MRVTFYGGPRDGQETDLPMPLPPNIVVSDDLQLLGILRSDEAPLREERLRASTYVRNGHCYVPMRQRCPQGKWVETVK